MAQCLEAAGETLDDESSESDGDDGTTETPDEESETEDTSSKLAKDLDEALALDCAGTANELAPPTTINLLSMDKIANYMRGLEVAYPKRRESSDESSAPRSETELSESHRAESVSSSLASTIAPEEAQRRLKKELRSKNTRIQRKKCVPKGDANAVTRRRKENKFNVHDSADIWWKIAWISV